MALLIYQKDNPQAIIVKGTMEELDENLSNSTIINKAGVDYGLDFTSWHGRPVKLFDPSENWIRVEEWEDSKVKKNLAEAEKKQKEQEKEIKARKDIEKKELEARKANVERMLAEGGKIQTPGMSLLGRRGN